MRQNCSKLWIFILILFIISGIFSFNINIPVSLEKKDDVHLETTISESVLEKDFKHFYTILKDFINVVFKGQESQLENGGIDAILGHTSTNTPISEDSEYKSDLQPCIITHISDGDTFIAKVGESEKTIRMIGIDTPESVHVDETKNNEWGNLASEHTKTLISEGQQVFLEYDDETTDQYGRTLAYVWLTADKSNIQNMLNAKILSSGYAMDKVFLPNKKYAVEFESIRSQAQANGTGLWSMDGFSQLWGL